MMVTYLKKYVFSFLLLFAALPFTALAQDNEQVIVEGIVMDADSLQPIPYVHVRAKHSNLGVVTREDGRFNIQINKQDTVIFSIVGYQSYVLTPNDSTAQSLRNLTIRMTPRTYMLHEIKVKDYIDITKYVQPKFDSTVDLRRPENIRVFEEKEPQPLKKVYVTSSETGGAALVGAVTAFANLFNDEYQQQKKLKAIMEVEEEEKRQQLLREAMTDRYQAMVQVVANLDEGALQRFTEAHMPLPESMMYMSDYKVMESIVLYMQDFEVQQEQDRLSIDYKLKNAIFEDREDIE